MSAARKDPRHRAREAALQVLYQWEVGRNEVEQAAETFFSQQWPGDEPAPKEVRRFATDLATATVARLAAIDSLIAETSERWRPARMGRAPR